MNNGRMLSTVVVIAASYGLVGCGGRPDDVAASDAPMHTVISVTRGADGQPVSKTMSISDADFLAMNARREARQRGFPLPPLASPSNGSGDIGEVQSALAIVADCDSLDSTWINSDINQGGTRVCLQFYSPGPSYDPYPYRSDFRVQSIWTGNTAAMLCTLRQAGYTCDWDTTPFPRGQRICDWVRHDDLNGSDHPQQIYWVQMPPWGACDPT